MFVQKNLNGLDAVKVLIKHGADVNQHGVVRQTPLCQAILCKAEKTVQFLLEHGANVNLRVNKNFLPMRHALFLGSAKIINLLLQHGSYFEQFVHRNWNCLTSAYVEYIALRTKIAYVQKGAQVEIPMDIRRLVADYLPYDLEELKEKDD